MTLSFLSILPPQLSLIILRLWNDSLESLLLRRPLANRHDCSQIEVIQYAIFLTVLFTVHHVAEAHIAVSNADLP